MVESTLFIVSMLECLTCSRFSSQVEGEATIVGTFSDYAILCLGSVQSSGVSCCGFGVINLGWRSKVGQSRDQLVRFAQHTPSTPQLAVISLVSRLTVSL